MIWPVIFLSYASLFALGFGDNVRGPLFGEMLRSFELSDARGAWIFAIGSLCGALGSLSSGFFLKRWDRVQCLNGALLLMSAGLLGMAVSPNFGALLGSSAVFGFSLGWMGVTQNVLASLSAAPGRRSQVLSGLQACYGIASLTAPVLVPPVVMWADSWRGAFFMAGLVPLVILIWSFFALPVEPAVLRERAQQHGATSRPGPVAVYFAFIVGAYVLAEVMVSSRLALYMQREQGADLTDASAMLATFFVCLLAGRILSTVIRWPLPLRWVLMLSAFSSMLCLILGLQGWVWGLALSGLTMGPFYPIVVAAMAEEIPHSLDGAMSVVMAMQSGCLVLMHLAVGWLTDGFGLTRALWLGPGSLLLAFFLLGLYGPLFRRRSHRV